VGRCDDGLIP
jgi:E3 ubiquitin-protein ligase BRE1